jgi:hypothetical protein
MKFLNRNGGNLAAPLPPWRKYCKYIYYAIVILYLFSRNASASSEDLEGGEKKVTGRYKVAHFNYDHVADLYSIVLWILLGAFVKVGK